MTDKGALLRDETGESIGIFLKRPKFRVCRIAGRLVWVPLLLLCLRPLAFSQDNAPQTTPPGQPDSAVPQPKGLKQRPSETAASQDTAAKKVGQITLDVTVTDPAGQPVSGLSEDDFTLLDNHQPAKIVSFRSVSGAADGGATDAATTTDPTQVILLIDEVNNSFQSVATERDQIVKYLGRNGGHLPFPVSIALFSDSGVKIDQPTQDGSVLIAELEKMPIPIHTINSAMGGQGAVERYQLSLTTLSHLLTYTGLKPGRKLLLWIGPGWPMMADVQFGSTSGDKHRNWDCDRFVLEGLAAGADDSLQRGFAEFRKRPAPHRFLQEFPEAGHQCEGRRLRQSGAAGAGVAKRWPGIERDQRSGRRDRELRGGGWRLLRDRDSGVSFGDGK